MTTTMMPTTTTPIITHAQTGNVSDFSVVSVVPEVATGVDCSNVDDVGSLFSTDDEIIEGASGAAGGYAGLSEGSVVLEDAGVVSTEGDSGIA